MDAIHSLLQSSVPVIAPTHFIAPDNLRSSVPASVAPTSPTVPEIFHSFELPAEALLVKRLQLDGKGSHRLQLYFLNSADIAVSDVASFIDNPHGALSRDFIDGFLEHLCLAEGSTSRGCRLPSKIWDMMISRDVTTRTRLARLIHAVLKQQTSSTFVLVPLHISDADWVLVVVYFSGSVCVFAPHAVSVPSSSLQSVRQFISSSWFMGLSTSTIDVKYLPESSSSHSKVMILHASALFSDNSANPRANPFPISSGFDPYAHSLLLFVLGLSTSF